MSMLPGVASKRWAILYNVLDTSTADTLVLDQSFFRPLGMQHFYDSFALVSQICVRREALTLFGLREDELLPDLHITGAGVLRIGLGAHQEHRVNHEARAADRTKVPAEVIRWQPMRWTPSLTRQSRLLVPVTLKVVKVRVTQSRMTLLFRWLLMLNSMSLCKLRMSQWARTFMTKKISLGRSIANSRDWSLLLRDGCWRGCPFPCKNVWTTLTEFWLGDAGKSMQHE